MNARGLHRRARELSFTLLEILIVMAIIAILATIGFPIYRGAIADAKNMRALAELKNVANTIDSYIAAKGYPPDSLADVGMDAQRDQWGNPYQYLRIDNLGGKQKGKNGQEVRKDRNLHPINTDYDLFSMGRDGRSAAPLTAQPSHDDIIRARNGAYFGLASEY